MTREEDNVRNCYCAIKATPKMSCEEENIAKAFQLGLTFGLDKRHDEAEWIYNKCSNCGKGIEDLIDSPEWYCNEEPNFCPFCGKKFKKMKNETYSFPEIFGEPIEMLIDGIWIKGRVINDYRSRDGIVNMETEDGKKYWCGCERKDCYRQPKEDK